MSDDLFNVLLRFHQEVVQPDIRGLGNELREEIRSLRNEMLSHFDAMYKRFDRLEAEYQASASAVARLEECQSEIEWAAGTRRRFIES